MIHPGLHSHADLGASHPTAGFDPILWIVLALAAVAVVAAVLRYYRDEA